MDKQTDDELRKWQNDVDTFMAESVRYRLTTDTRLGSVERELARNTRMTSEMHVGLKDALPALKDLGGAWRTIKRIARIFKPLLYLAMLVFAVVAWMKTGRWEWPVL